MKNIEAYASKHIKSQIREAPDIIGLSLGEPVFGPPEDALKEIENDLRQPASYAKTLKYYEDSRGPLDLRTRVAEWYMRRYGWAVDPDREVLITHGGVGALTLAILITTEPGDEIGLSDPTYMLYSRLAKSLGRQLRAFERRPAVHEYPDVAEHLSTWSRSSNSNSVLIINSPENPSGYVADRSELEMLANTADATGLWVVHDEVYDTFTFGRRHYPLRLVGNEHPRLIQVNSFSKKFGVPGLRVGWMIAAEDVIDRASGLQDYIYLSIASHSARIAELLLKTPTFDLWSHRIARELGDRATNAISLLDQSFGFEWVRRPLGGMFLFPDVSGIFAALPERYKTSGKTVGEIVASYLLNERRVAVVPGRVYGKQGNNSVRMVLCVDDGIWSRALQALAVKL